MVSSVTSPLPMGSGENDAAGRSQVAQTTSLGDYVLSRDALPLYFDNVEGGTASAAYDADINGWVMDVLADGDYAIFQTKQRHPYYPGHAQQPEFTYINLIPETDVIKRIGYFSSNTNAPFGTNRDGIYLESGNNTVNMIVSKNGVEYFRSADLSTAMDWTKFNVTMFDFLYLGGTSVTHYQIFDRTKSTISTYDHANHVADTILANPAQPIRAEIRSTGGTGSFTFVCANVGSNGSTDANFGTPVNIDTGASAIDMNTGETKYVALAVKKNDASIEFFPLAVNVTSNGGAQNVYRWRLLLNPVLSGALTYSALNDTHLDYAVGAGETVTTDGFVIGSGVGASRSSNSVALINALRIGQTISGVYDTLVLEITPDANNQGIMATLNGIVV